MSMKEEIEWKAVADELPDSDITVLVFFEAKAEVWRGYYGDDCFYLVSGTIADDVTHWADMPFGPGVIVTEAA